MKWCKYVERECGNCGQCATEKLYYCPVCGNEVYENVYQSNGIIVGCDQCIERTPYYELGV